MAKVSYADCVSSVMYISGEVEGLWNTVDTDACKRADQVLVQRNTIGTATVEHKETPTHEKGQEIKSPSWKANHPKVEKLRGVSLRMTAYVDRHVIMNVDMYVLCWCPYNASHKFGT